MSLSEDEKQEFVDVTNMYRCMHGAPNVEWNDEMYQNIEETFGGMDSMMNSDP